MFRKSSSEILSSDHQDAVILIHDGNFQFDLAVISFDVTTTIPFSNKKSIPSRNSESDI